MLPEEYIKNVLKTENTNLKEIKERINKEDIIRLLHASMGINTEAGEFADQLKKYIFYERELGIHNLSEELGDLLWYIALALDTLGISFEEVWKQNVRKLESRYGSVFSKEKAKNRDLEKEYKVLIEGLETKGKKPQNYMERTLQINTKSLL